MQSAIERYLKEKNYPLGIVHPREFHNSKVIYRRNYTSCTFKFLLQRQLEVSASSTEEKEGLPSLIQGTIIKL